MEQKQLFCLEIKKGDFIFSFNMPAGASWGSALDAAFDVLNFVSTSARQAAENAKPVQENEQIDSASIVSELVEGE